jgi:D-arabinan exo alpha-(1,3)/(1,5)-arabinofuranosidase (non-reducing end)
MQPQVDTPLDQLFAAALGDAAEGYALGRQGDHFYCYFPMPFLRSARIELRNDGPTPFEGWQLRLTAVGSVTAAHPAYFSGFSNRATLEPDGNDYLLLDAQGTGHVVAAILTAGCGRATECELPNLPGVDGAHLEGDERIYIDGSRYPQIHGTGLEDFFNGGFYFARGAFVLPTHGNPSQAPMSERRPGLNLRSAYRFFLGDAVPFYAGIRVTIEHGPTNDVPAEMSSTVLYYGVSEATLVETDQIEVGSDDSEEAHDFAVADRADLTLTSYFRGDASDSPFTAMGLSATRTSFRIAIDAANRGVRLRRLADIGAGAQSAEVLVDGQPAGTWYSPDINPYLRWADLDFDLPEALTVGRSFLEIELGASESPAPWTAFGYQVFSYRDTAAIGGER